MALVTDTPGEPSDDRAVTPAVGVVLLVAITVVLAAVIGVFAIGLTDDLGERPTFAALDLPFEESPASAPHYDEVRWAITLTNTADETVGLIIVHNNRTGNTIPADLDEFDEQLDTELDGEYYVATPEGVSVLLG